jgi:urea transport system permease protein
VIQVQAQAVTLMSSSSGVSLGYDILANSATLLLLCLGLALVFATRGIVNLAHGEFVMLGCYTAVQLSSRGVPLVFAIAGAATTGLILGVVLERLLIRRLYARVADCMLATWGVSLIAVQVVTIVFGSTSTGIPIPMGSFSVGGYSKATYSLVVIGLAIAEIVAIYYVMRRTGFGFRARAVATDSAMAEAVGVDSRTVDTTTFAIAATSAGFAGGVLAPLLGVSPTMGSGFIAQVFMAVIVGGANFVVGTPLAALLLGGAQSGLAAAFAPIAGQVGLLLIAILIVRIWPGGLTRTMVRR